jgi:hypothetical protein
VLILGLLLILAGLVLAYFAGKDAGDRAVWQAAQAPSRDRHPGGRDL